MADVDVAEREEREDDMESVDEEEWVGLCCRNAGGSFLAGLGA